jgi:hypothetical protein
MVDVGLPALEFAASVLKISAGRAEILHMFMAASGSAKANGRDREPITCLGQVFKYKLSCFDDVRAFIYVNPHPHLELLLLPVDTPCFVYKSLETVSFLARFNLQAFFVYCAAELIKGHFAMLTSL